VQPENAPGGSFAAAISGDGRPLVLLTATCLALAGGFAVFLGLSGSFLPQDVAFLGVGPEELCRLQDCRVVGFMIHDRIAFGGVLLSVATLYAWLALFPLRTAEKWAWRALAFSGVCGFASFLAYLGYGYLDTWHGLATLLLAPIFVAGLIMTRPGNPLGTTAVDQVREHIALTRRGATGRALVLLAGIGCVVAGATILVVGATRVFVPQDLGYLGTTAVELGREYPRLVPLIAHDRAGFGGGLLTTGILVVAVTWYAPPSRHVWEALAVAGAFGFGCAIGTHYLVDYHDLTHVGPAWAGAAVLVLGLSLAASDYRNARTRGDARLHTQ
jgi:hypothetical protein